MNIEEEIYEALDAENEAAGFRIDDDNKASWALRIIKNEREEAERLAAIADSQIAELQEKKEALAERCERRTNYLKGLLYEYFGMVEHKETKTQASYKLLDGSLVFKKPTQKMVPDKDKLLAYVKANDMAEFVKVTEAVDWAAYKKECEINGDSVVNVQTGEVLPSDIIAVEEVPGDFSIKVG